MPATAVAPTSPHTAAAPTAGLATAPLGHPGEVLVASPAPVSAALPSPVDLARPATSAAMLAATVLASRKADPAVGGRLARPRRPHKPATAAAPSPSPSVVPAAAMAGGSVAQLPVPESGLVPCTTAPLSPASRCSIHDASLARSCWPAGAGGCGGNARRLSYAKVVSSTPASQRGAGAAGREEDASVGWQEVPSRYRPRCSTLVPRPLPAWLNGRCCRCLFPGHRAAACRDPIRCSHCLGSGHRARECFNAWKPLSSLPGLMVSSQPRLIVHPCHGKNHVDQSPPLRRSSTSPTPVVPDVQSTLTEQALLLRSELHACLARVESFLVRAGTSLDMLPIVPEASPPAEVIAGSAEVGEENLYGSFSPVLVLRRCRSPTCRLPVRARTQLGSRLR
jgi:hypothetical protein